MGRKVLDSLLTIFFFSFPDASLWESSMPIFTTLRQMLHGCYLKDHSNLPYEIQHEC